MADRDGRIEDRPRRIKAEILPYDDCDCDQLLAELAAANFIIRYESGGRKCLEIKNFVKHQCPHPNEPASELPAHCGSTCANVTSTSDNGASASPFVTSICASSLNPSSLNPSLSGETENGKIAGEKEFDLIASEYPPGKRRDSPVALGVFRSMMIPAAEVPNIIAGIKAWKADPEWQRENGRFVKKLSEFLSGRKWQSCPTSAPAEPTESLEAYVKRQAAHTAKTRGTK